MNWQIAKDVFKTARFPDKGKPLDYRGMYARQSIINGEECYVIRLYGTDVITFYPDGSVALKTEGWSTSSTRNKINSFQRLGEVYQERCRLYAVCHGKTYLFKDNMRIYPDGRVEGAELAPPRRRRILSMHDSKGRLKKYRLRSLVAYIRGNAVENLKRDLYATLPYPGMDTRTVEIESLYWTKHPGVRVHVPVSFLITASLPWIHESPKVESLRGLYMQRDLLASLRGEPKLMTLTMQISEGKAILANDAAVFADEHPGWCFDEAAMRPYMQPKLHTTAIEIGVAAEEVLAPLVKYLDKIRFTLDGDAILPKVKGQSV